MPTKDIEPAPSDWVKRYRAVSADCRQFHNQRSWPATLFADMCALTLEAKRDVPDLDLP